MTEQHSNDRERQELSSAISNLIAARRMRDAHFPGSWFADPAWDALLHLFRSELDDQIVTMGDLCAAAAVPYSTAFKWIERMVAAGLIQRQKDPSDKRRAILSLTERPRAGMREYLLALRQGQANGGY